MKSKPLMIFIFIPNCATHVIAQIPSTESIAVDGKVLADETNLPFACVRNFVTMAY
jgi:hypothetical protein